jgi:hypothetical protein
MLHALRQEIHTTSNSYICVCSPCHRHKSSCSAWATTISFHVWNVKWQNVEIQIVENIDINKWPILTNLPNTSSLSPRCTNAERLVSIEVYRSNLRCMYACIYQSCLWHSAGNKTDQPVETDWLLKMIRLLAPGNSRWVTILFLEAKLLGSRYWLMARVSDFFRGNFFSMFVALTPVVGIHRCLRGLILIQKLGTKISLNNLIKNNFVSRLLGWLYVS